MQYGKVNEFLGKLKNICGYTDQVLSDLLSISIISLRDTSKLSQSEIEIIYKFKDVLANKSKFI